MATSLAFSYFSVCLHQNMCIQTSRIKEEGKKNILSIGAQTNYVSINQLTFGYFRWTNQATRQQLSNWTLKKKNKNKTPLFAKSETATKKFGLIPIRKSITNRDKSSGDVISLFVSLLAEREGCVWSVSVNNPEEESGGQVQIEFIFAYIVNPRYCKHLPTIRNIFRL